MLSVTMLNVTMLNVLMLNVVMLNVVAPYKMLYRIGPDPCPYDREFFWMKTLVKSSLANSHPIILSLGPVL